MVSLRLWPLLLAWLLVIIAFLLTPRPLAGQPTAAVHLPDTTITTTITTSPRTSAATTTTTRSGLHAGPGHDCDRCADTANLPPWRRRMAEKAAAARNQYEAEF